jgi:hypothetical protein
VEGLEALGSSLGRTSTPQVSVATAATLRFASHGIVKKLRPGASPPAYVPQPCSKQRAICPVRSRTMSPAPTSTRACSAAASRSSAVIA